MTTTHATPATSTTPDLAAVKAKQQKTWSSGDYSVIATQIQLPSDLIAEACDLRAGWRVLDVACGSGNASLAAARSGTHVVGVDYVPELLEKGRARATAENLDVEFRLGDAEDLPVADDSFDAALSVVGSMFAPNHQRTAAELVRAVRPGGVIGLVSWTPAGFIGQMFRTITSHVPGPKGVQSPMLWGTEEHLAELFGAAAAEIRSVERTAVWRFHSPEDLVDTFRRWYGPALKAFEALDESGKIALAADLAALAGDWDRNKDGGSVAIPATYLETVITLR
ncbi:class I SAM-dependent methyltransferase [Frankia sp. CNm7]|uniref:Class I SAM-dependent methyltransferase n=1 Tax=Frankia nepalensis TaxID=1836974 RepID=A0A937RPW0_9ACTN|nr:class I SAM-dependent methyltransferase [Frankia nepalensis]MBL7499979.1 class I SAM-dependent methyltransferase [Frankia nepalensis]MBL7512512.1 class I SAM-dependent methyltransferase [Frankia nepalensis]MBL7517435.1 class I SAM-dependent methyltransferase [Frankia nepalensis]MBL7632815.1 class I SAM-dependent methyltransferase [Frankia nepalensis]